MGLYFINFVLDPATAYDVRCSTIVLRSFNVAWRRGQCGREDTCPAMVLYRLPGAYSTRSAEIESTESARLAVSIAAMTPTKIQIATTDTRGGQSKGVTPCASKKGQSRWRPRCLAGGRHSSSGWTCPAPRPALGTPWLQVPLGARSLPYGVTPQTSSCRRFRSWPKPCQVRQDFQRRQHRSGSANRRMQEGCGGDERPLPP